MADKNDGSDKHWSSFYDEEEDNFDEFKRFEVTEDAPARQMSGSVVEEEAAKDWEEDWEDEDKEDTFAHITGLIDAAKKK